MSEVLSELFSGNQAADIAFWIIVGLSFLLGMLLFALLAYWPAKRRLSKELARVQKEQELLTKDHKDLSERFTAINTQYKHTQEELQVTKSKLKEQEGIVARQQREIQYLKEELEAHKAQARNYKQANERLLTQFQKAAKANDIYERKLEDLKDLVEEVEQERSQLQQDYRKSQREGDHANQQNQQLQQEQQAWKKKTAELEQDLVAALQQRTELKQLLEELEDNQQLGNSTDEELKKQVLEIKAHLKSLEAENTELMKRLAPYLAQEQEHDEEDAAIEPLLVDLFIEAEESLKKEGFFEDYKEEDLVENPQQLAKALREMEDLTKKAGAVKQEEVLLEEEDEESLSQSLAQAALAMERQGFYENMEEAVLVPLSQKIQQLSDEELLQERLADTATILEQSSFYNKEEVNDDLIEEKELLEVELAKLDEVTSSRNLEATAVLELTKEELEDLDGATVMAQNALDQPGLYEPMEAETLLADNKYETPLEETDKVSEQQRLEQLVTQEIGNRIPRANAQERDALQEIDGIGQFMEQQLNQLGIYTYEQISLFDQSFVNTLSAALDFPASVIHEKEWVTQAKNKLTRP
ncbi:MAG: hypothetical protein ACRBFS_06925 [Aureispira sp.]